MAFQYQMLINGQWVSSPEKIEIRNPYDDALLGMLPIASPQQVNEAITVARNACKEMADLPAYERANILEKTAQLITENHTEMTTAIVQEAGKAWKWASGEVDRAIGNLKFAAEEAKRLHGETVPLNASPGSENRIGFWMRVPVGVVGAITPFNFPLNLVVHKVAPAIAAGNSVVLKPASKTPKAAQLLCTYLLQAGLPKTALNLVYGEKTVGEAIVTDERIAKLTFTGSPAVGRRINAISGLKKVTLELGSNSGCIVDETADLDLAVSRNLIGSFAYSGQVCISVQRIYVHQAVYDAFAEKFIRSAQKLQLGDPMDSQTDLGPMISGAEIRRVEKWLKAAKSAGAEILAGGKPLGNIFPPTILGNVKPEMAVVCQEVFAPVVSLIKFSNFDQAIEMVDDSIYGLQAGIFTRDINRAFSAVKRINAGGIIINDIPTYRADNMPYGGNKESGIGREGAKFAVEEMTNIKMVVLNLPN